MASLPLLLAVLPLAATSDRIREAVQARASGALGRPVSIARMRLRLLGGPRLILTGVTLGNLPGFPPQPLATVAEVRADLSLSSLWSDRVRVDRLGLRGAAIVIVRRADGRSNLDGPALSPPVLPSGRGLAAALPRGRTLEVSRIRLEDVRIAFRDAAAGVETDVSGLALDARVGDLPLAGAPDAASLLQRAAFQGTLTLAGARSEGLSLQALRCTLSLDRGVARLAGGEATLNGGPLRFEACVDCQDAARPAFSLKADLRAVQLTAELGKRYLGRFLACFSDALEGQVSRGRLDLSWRGTSREEINGSLSGKGELGLSVRLLDLSPLLPSALGAVARELVTFTRAGVIFTVGGGVVSNTLRLEADDNGATLSGTMRLADLQSDYLLVCTGRLGDLTHHTGIPLRGVITDLRPDLGAAVKDAVKDRLLDQFQRLFE